MNTNLHTSAQQAPWLPWLQRLRIHWQTSFGYIATPQDQIELVQRRIYLLPSRRGLAIIVLAIILLLIAINYQLSLAYVVAFLLAGILQAAMLLSYRNLRGLILQATASPRCVSGESLSFSVLLQSPERVRNGISLSTTALLGDRLATQRRSSQAQSKSNASITSTAPISVDKDEHLLVMLSYSTTQRGIFKLPRISVSSVAPYGLIRAWSYVRFDWAAIVSPSPEHAAPPIPHGQIADSTQSTRTNCAPEDPDGLRDYQPGDSLRRVLWKQIAKSGQWYTRTGNGVDQGNIELSWQAEALRTLINDEVKLSRLMAWLQQVHSQNRAFSLQMPNAQLMHNEGVEHYNMAVMACAAYPNRPETISGIRAY